MSNEEADTKNELLCRTLRLENDDLASELRTYTEKLSEVQRPSAAQSPSEGHPFFQAGEIWVRFHK